MSDFSDTTGIGSWVGCSSFTWTLAFIYIPLLLVARWFWIMAPSRRQLRSQVEGFRVRLQTQLVLDVAGQKGPGTSRAAVIAQVLAEADVLMDSIESHDRFWKRLFDLIYGSDVYLKYWRIYHSLEVRALQFDESACLRWLILSPESLMGVPGSARQIKTLEELVAKRDEKYVPRSSAMSMAATLANFAYEYRDTYYAKLADWNNKAAWLVIVALFFVISLVATESDPNGFLLIGGLGGFLAKLRSTIYRADVPTDYGASWTTLFLIPLVGALTGWAGIKLVKMLVETEILGEFIGIQLTMPGVAPGLALLFGYGATLFDRLAVSASNKLANP